MSRYKFWCYGVLAMALKAPVTFIWKQSKFVEINCQTQQGQNDKKKVKQHCNNFYLSFTYRPWCIEKCVNDSGSCIILKGSNLFGFQYFLGSLIMVEMSLHNQFQHPHSLLRHKHDILVAIGLAGDGSKGTQLVVCTTFSTVESHRVCLLSLPSLR